MGKKFISYVMTAVLLVCSVLPHIGVTSVHAAVSNPNVNYLNNSAYASVHDPTILKEGNTYYMYSTGIIGQGVELRTSTDMIHWTYVSDFANKHNSSLKTSAVMAATGNSMTNIWAPNVIKVGNEFWMYYSCSSGGSRNSCIALATATSPSGPFTYKGIVIQTSNSTASNMNAIDACVEYDGDGNMWMAYGSFFGGIRVVQLNKNTGFVKTAGDEGTLIASRPSSIDNGAMEGPIIRYHDGYYYLFVSYDNLLGPERNGGGSYHIRVGRSRTINGEYVDQDGVSMKQAGETTGYKLTANYKFNNSTGWWAVGHCDVYQDPDNGKWFYASHARINGNENAPYSYIHQLTWNSEGWPVISPEPYAGETIGPMTVADAAGAYERIAFHDNKETLSKTLTSVTMKLNSDYSATIAGVSGTGKWSFSGDNTVTVTVGNVTEVYTLMEGWDAENSKATVVLTGNDMSSGKTGLQRWAKRTEQYAAPGYTITVASNNNNYGTVTGGGTVNSGNAVTVTASAKTGYRFIHWVDSTGAVVSNSASYQFVPVNNQSLTAMFSKETNPTITAVSNNSAYGTAKGGGSTAVGQEVTLMATPVGGSRFVAWKDAAGNVLSTDSVYTMRAYETQTITAYFESLTQYTVADYLSDGSKFYNTVDSTGNTKATLSGQTKLTEDGVTVTGSDGDQLQSNYVRMDNPLLNSDAEAITVSAYMTINETENYAYKTLFTFYTDVGFLTITADGGIHLNDWAGNYFDDNGKTWTPDGAEHLYAMVVTNDEIRVYEDGTLINAYACGSNVLAFIKSCQYVSLGTGNDTYSVENGGWSWGSAAAETSEFIVMEAELTEADLESMVAGGEACTVTVQANGSGTVSGPTEAVNAGKTATVIATANNGYRFAYWKNAKGEIVSTSASYTFKVKENTELTAYFLAESQFVDVTVTSENEEKGTVTGGGKDIIAGTSMTVTATPAANYKFVGWKEGNTVVSKEISYTFEVTKDRTLVAVFEVDEDQIATKTFLPKTDSRLWAYYPFEGNVTNQVNDHIASLVAAGGAASYATAQYTTENYTLNGANRTGKGIQLGGYGLKLANDVPMNASAYTISFWMKTNNYNGNYTAMFYLYNQDTGDWTSILMNTPVNSNNCIQTWSEVDGTQTNKTTTTTANSGKWINVILTVDGHTGDLYINGDKQITGIAVGDIFTTNNYSIYVAANPWSADGLFYAAYDELYIYEGVLDSAEIATLANKGNYNNGDFAMAKLALQSNIANAGTLYGADEVVAGNEATIIARAADGYKFVKWTNEAGDTVSTSEVYTFTPSTSGTYTYTAVFEQTTVEPIQEYTVTATANPAEGGSITGAGTYEAGTSVTLTATAAEGYVFTSWTEGGQVVGNQETYTIASLNADMTVTANFTKKPTLYTVITEVNPAEGGSVTGAGTYEEGARVTLEAVAADGYVFTNWTRGGNVVGEEPAYTISSLDRDMLVTANFTKKAVQYTVTTIVNPAEGGSVTGAGTYEEGTSVTLTATAAEGYVFTNWTIDGIVTEGEAAYTIASLDADTTVTANFTKKVVQYTVTTAANPAEGGSVTGAGTYEEGTSVTLTATAAEGYAFTNWTIDGIVTEGEAAYTIDSLNGDMIVTANFTKVEEPNPEVPYTPLAYYVSNGTEFYDTINPSLTGELHNATVSSESVTMAHSGNGNTGHTNYVQMNNPLKGTTVTEATISALGTVSSNGTYDTVFAFYTDVGFFSLSADGSIHFNDWNGNYFDDAVDTAISDASEEHLYSIVISDSKIEVYCDGTVINTYSGAMVSNVKSFLGTVDYMSLGTGNDTMGAGGQTWSWPTAAMAVKEYIVIDDALTAGQLEKLPGTFKVPEYTVKTVANPAEGGSVTGAGTYEAGTSVTLTATAAEGYAFTNWTIDGIVTEGEAAYTIASLDADTTVTANFTKKVVQYTVTTAANPAEGGSVTGAGTYEEGTSVTLTATAAEGYAFTNWMRGGNIVGAESTYTIDSLNGDMLVTANFTKVEEPNPEVPYTPLAYYVSNGTEFYDTINPSLTGELHNATVSSESVTMAHSGNGNTGHTNYVQMNNPLKGTTVTEATISALGTVSSNGTYDTVFAFYTDVGFFSLSADGSIHFNDWNGNYFDNEVNTAISDASEEHLYSVVISDSKIEVYCDGTVINTYSGAMVSNVKSFLGTVDYMSLGTGNDTVGAGGQTWSWPTAAMAVKEYIVIDDALTAEQLEKLPGTFKVPEYTVTTAANPIEGGSVTIGGTFEAGTLVTETATPAEGYQFVSWTDETGKVVSKSASYAFTVTADVTLTANFKVKGTGGQVSDKLIFAYLFDDLDNWHKSETDTDIFETFTVVNWDEKPFNHEVLTGPRSDKYIDTDRTNMPWGPSAQEGDYYLDFLGTYNGVSNTSEMYGIKAGGSVTLPETNTFTLSYDYLFPNSNNQADYGTITLLFGEGEQNYITIKQGGGQIYTVKDGITSYQHETYYSWRMTEDTWYHVTLSFSQTEGEADGRVVIYLTPYDSNGNLLTNRTETITQSTSGQVLKIPAFSSQNVTMYLGTGLNASYTHQAYLDNLYMFSDALTEDEVQEEIGQLNYPIVTSDKVIVLDYGLDVITDLIGVQFSDEISDMELAGIRYSTEALPETGTEPEGGFGTSAQGSYGTAAIENGTNSVRYQLSRMLDGAEVIQFAVKYTYTDNKVKYAYHTLTIIPAKTVYYEDTFVSDNTVTEAGSSQDRTQSDKNVVYGYDNAYAGTSDVNSNGTAAAITDALTFNFTGTGFELIGRTDTDGYMIKVKVKDTNGATKKLVYLNTYYEDGALYQLPLISITGLAHRTYTVELSLFDKNGAEEGNGWTFYLDGVRIFDPLESGDPLTGHYATGEAEAEYQSIRNMILGEKPQAFITSYQNGTVGIGAGSTYVEQYDGTNQGVEGENKPSVNVSKLSDYLQSGPNNELYLTPGNAVAFLVSPAEAEGLLQFGAKTLNGEAGQITVATSVNSSIATNSYTVATRTEMYYSVLSERTAISGTDRTLVVIANTSSSDTIISLTKLKKYGYTFADSMLTNEDFLINCGESGDYQAVIEVLEQIFEGELGTVTDTEGFNIEIMGAQLKKEDAGYAEGTLGIIAGIPIGDYYADMDAISEIGMVLTTSDVYKADVTIGSLTEQQKQEIADLLTANTEKDGIKTIKTTALQYDYTGSSTAAFRTVISNITDVDRTYFVRPYAMINGTPVYGEVYAVSLAYVQEKLGVTGGQN